LAIEFDVDVEIFVLVTAFVVGESRTVYLALANIDLA
jgi:hypothetical protein